MRSCSASTLAAKSSSSWDAALTDCPTQDWAYWCTFAYERYFSWPFFSFWPFFSWSMNDHHSNGRCGLIPQKDFDTVTEYYLGRSPSTILICESNCPLTLSCFNFLNWWIEEIVALFSMWSPVDFCNTTLLLFAEIGKALATYWTCIGDSFLRSHKKLTVKLLACVAFLSMSLTLYTSTLNPQKSPWCKEISPS